jgi:phage shock protein A
MADENPAAALDWRLLGQQVTETRLRIGQLDGRVNELGRDIKVLMLMARNQDEAMKEMRSQFGEMLGAMSAINNRLERIERRLDLVEG